MQPNEPEVRTVAVYEYHAIKGENHQEYHAEGTVVARNKLHAMDLLRAKGYFNARLKQLGGLSAFVRQLTADVR